MIKLLSFLAITFLLALTPNTEQKENNYTLTEGQTVLTVNSMAQAKQLLLNSDIPAKQVTQINMAFDSIQTVLIKQYNTFHPDTTHH